MEHPSFQCQSCNANLHITGFNALHRQTQQQQLQQSQQDSANVPPSTGPSSSQTVTNSSISTAGRQPGWAGRPLEGAPAGTSSTSRMDDSFIQIDPARLAFQEAGGAGSMRGGGPGGPSARQRQVMEESFVMLGSASLLRPSSAGLEASTRGLQPQSFDQKFATLAATFEIASDATKVDQPLCSECSAKVQKELEAEVREVEAEVEAFQAALERLSASEHGAMPEAEFEELLAAEEAAESVERQRAEQLEAELAQAVRELSSLQAASKEIDKLEENYWREFNDFQLQLRVHVDERDTTLSKIARAESQLERLKSTSVFNDVFHIWHAGAFGTISGFRLGRMPTMAVEWDEINAAWGQSVLLLHTLAQACKLTFSHGRLLPMGSHPRISDNKGTHDLYGPVSRFVCTGYDKAMVCFLACLKEFAEFARSRDLAGGSAQGFELPYAIDADKGCVGGLTIKLIFNKDARWCKALKYMLANLKWVQKWVIAQQDGALSASLSAMPLPSSVASSSILGF